MSNPKAKDKNVFCEKRERKREAYVERTNSSSTYRQRQNLLYIYRFLLAWILLVSMLTDGRAQNHAGKETNGSTWRPADDTKQYIRKPSDIPLSHLPKSPARRQLTTCGCCSCVETDDPKTLQSCADCDFSNTDTMYVCAMCI